MALSGEALDVLHSVDEGQTKDLVTRFVEHASAQSWPFSYTDKIGDFCERVYHAVPDPEVRAGLLMCAIEVGVEHNRWHVLEIAEGLIGSNRSPAESIALAERVQNASRTVKEWIRENLPTAKRDRLLAKALEERGGDSI
jgi:hypothetical protein